VQSIKMQVPLKAVDASSTGNIPASDIIYVSCDSNVDTSNITPDQILQVVTGASPVGNCPV
jgi:hypothetical protein